MIYATSREVLAYQSSTTLQKLAQIGMFSICLTGVSLAANYHDEAQVMSGSQRVAPFQFRNETDELQPMERIRDWIAEKYDLPSASVAPALSAAEESGMAQGVDPLLIIAVIATESSFDPRAVSKQGARGLMQVMPKYHQDKVGKLGKAAWFDPKINVRAGTQVLKECIDRYGNVQSALQFYNGSLNDRSKRYSRKVLALKKQLAAISIKTSG